MQITYTYIKFKFRMNIWETTYSSNFYQSYFVQHKDLYTTYFPENAVFIIYGQIKIHCMYACILLSVLVYLLTDN